MQEKLKMLKSSIIAHRQNESNLVDRQILTVNKMAAKRHNA